MFPHLLLVRCSTKDANCLRRLRSIHLIADADEDDAPKKKGRPKKQPKVGTSFHSALVIPLVIILTSLTVFPGGERRWC